MTSATILAARFTGPILCVFLMGRFLHFIFVSLSHSTLTGIYTCLFAITMWIVIQRRLWNLAICAIVVLYALNAARAGELLSQEWGTADSFQRTVTVIWDAFKGFVTHSSDPSAWYSTRSSFIVGVYSKYVALNCNPFGD